MTGKIYLIQEDGTLQSLTERHYDSEDLLQGLLARYPDLLAGDQIDESAPRRWLLLSREAGIPIEEDGADHLSLDHLFLDQDAIPTLVEVKRSSDTRIRREVVGQMLDYASHAVAYWSADALRTRFETACDAQDQDAGQAVAQLLGTGPEDAAAVDAFWGQVKTNLEAGRIRLVFVADEVPPELRRVVEFLNRFMKPVEVLAVEVHQYVGRGLKTLVPRVIGHTEEAKARKTGRVPGKKQWNQELFMEDLQARRDAAAVSVASQILAWAQNNGLRIWWGQGQQDGSFFPMLDHNGDSHWLISVWTYGRLEIQFEMLQKKPPFDSETLRLDLLRRLNAIPGISFPESVITRRPSIPLGMLKDHAVLRQFFSILAWVMEQIKSSS